MLLESSHRDFSAEVFRKTNALSASLMLSASFPGQLFWMTVLLELMWFYMQLTSGTIPEL